MNEDRILDKLDRIEEQGRNLLVGVTQLQEQVKAVPKLEDRVTGLEKWRWMVMGALGASGVSLATQVYGVLRGA